MPVAEFNEIIYTLGNSNCAIYITLIINLYTILKLK